MNGFVIIVSNLKYRKLGGIESQGMILCGSKENKIEIIRPENNSV
jgi:tRNA-binding EMAP/Myf-like protein